MFCHEPLTDRGNPLRSACTFVLKKHVQNHSVYSSSQLRMTLNNLPPPQGDNRPDLAAAKLRRISAVVTHAPASVTSLDAVFRIKNRVKKCQQNCQQKSSRGVRREFGTSSPVLFESSPISVPKTRGEGRRFRPSPPIDFPQELDPFPPVDPPTASKSASKALRTRRIPALLQPYSTRTLYRCAFTRVTLVNEWSPR
jgi:hypothetical protein